MQIHPVKPSRGFTLIEMAIVLLIAGVAAGLLLSASTSMLDAQKRKTVREQLNTLDAALANFVAVNKRLPCPANGTIASGALNAGVETLVVATGLCNPATQVNGVVPWVTLGVAEAVASDPWFGRFTYRVDPTLAGSAPFSLLMDMSNCDPAGAAPAPAGICVSPCTVCVAPCSGPACTPPNSFLVGKGSNVSDGVTPLNVAANGTGAAYVIISHGTTGAGAYNSSGNLQPGSVGPITILPVPAVPPFTQPAGDHELPNMNNQALLVPPATYRDAQLNDIRTQAHFDDYLSHPNIMTVLKKANLGPRAH